MAVIAHISLCSTVIIHYVMNYEKTLNLPYILWQCPSEVHETFLAPPLPAKTILLQQWLGGALDGLWASLGTTLSQLLSR